MALKKNLDSQIGQSNKISDLLQKILSETGNNLNQIVGNNSFIIPAEVDENFSDDLQSFLELLREAYREDKDILYSLDELTKNTNSDKFMAMLKRYLEMVNQPVKETTFLRDIPIETFGKMVQYCYSNFVINNYDMKENNGDWETEQLQILRKVVLTIADMVALQNFPKQRVLDQINRMFELGDERGEILWNTVKSDEEKLWKYLMVTKCERIEEKLELVLDLIQNAH